MKKKQKKEDKLFSIDSKKRRDGTITGGNMHKDFSIRDTITHAPDR
jgi:hypothetical protein